MHCRFTESWLRRAIENAQKNAMLEERQMLLTSIEQDTDLDVWRELFFSVRSELLRASRVELLAVYEVLLHEWLRGFLQENMIDVADETRVVPAAERVGPGSVKLEAMVVATRHPTSWRLGATLASQLEPIVNYAGDGHGVQHAVAYQGRSVDSVHAAR